MRTCSAIIMRGALAIRFTERWGNGEAGVKRLGRRKSNVKCAASQQFGVVLKGESCERSYQSSEEQERIADAGAIKHQRRNLPSGMRRTRHPSKGCRALQGETIFGAVNSLRFHIPLDLRLP